MKKNYKELINERYNRRLIKYGDDIRTLASGNIERRNIRYKILFELGLANNTRVLELGCGFGDFNGYLCSKGIKVNYVGYDINPNLIDIAKEKYPNAKFEVKDIQEETFPNFDYIVSSSSFNLMLEEGENYTFLENILKTCFSHSYRGVAVDFLTSYCDYKLPKAFHYEPEKVLRISKKITKRVCLRHDYPLFEFCVYLYPDFKGWQKRK